MLKRLWNDECGAVLSAELILLVTILGIGMVTGLKALQSAVVDELGEVGTAISIVSQAYSFSGSTGNCASSAGSAASDEAEHEDVDECAAGAVTALGVDD